MKIDFTACNIPDNYEQFIIHQKSSCAVTVGNNPTLSLVFHKTWSWPLIEVAFFIEDIPVAFYSALKTIKGWVSLPHSSFGSLWVNSVVLREILLGDDMDGDFDEEIIRAYFYHFFYDVLSSNDLPQKNILRARVDLGSEDFKIHSGEPLHSDKPLLFECRCFHRLSSHYKENKTVSILQLQPTFDLQQNCFSPSVRRKIRKAKKNGIEIEVGGGELCDAFYEVYRKNIHRLGSFGLPKRFFIRLFTIYNRGMAKIIIARINGRIVGSAIILTYLGFAENPWFATLKEANKLYVSYLLHNTMIELAIEERCTEYSLGRSTTNGTHHHYKKQWGTTDKQLFFNYPYPVNDFTEKHSYLKQIIKRVPICFSKPFDEFVSRRIY